ncbi:MAG: protein translocase subunit SecF, partial [Oscillospiraceae bacterium]|nr:protein translocase subunit SecF [Oscillospiraceae bacterium]
MKFNFDFIKNKKIYFIISAVLISVSLLSTFVFGVNLDIQFKGGTILTFLYDGEIDQAEFEKTATEALDGLGVTSTIGED